MNARAASSRLKRFGAAHQKQGRFKFLLILGGFTLLSLFAGIVVLTLNFEPVSAKIQSPPQSDNLNDAGPGFGTVKLLAPANLIRKGEKLDNVVLTHVYWPRDTVPQGAC